MINDRLSTCITKHERKRSFVQRSQGIISRLAWIIVPVILLLCLFVYFLQLPPVDPLHVEPDQRVSVHCPLQAQACRVHLGDLVLELSLSPKGLPALETLSLEISSLTPSSPALTNFKAWFEGRDMEMGHHVFNRVSVPNNTIRAETMIPVCSIDSKMIWRLNIDFDYADKYTRLQFDLSSDHLGSSS